MDFQAYSVLRFHGANRTKHETQQYRGTIQDSTIATGHALLSQAAKQLGRRPLRTVWNVTVQSTLFNINAVASTPYLASHPIQTLAKAKDIALHPLEHLTTVVDAVLRPVIAGQESEVAPAQTPNEDIELATSSAAATDRDYERIGEYQRLAKSARLNEELQNAVSHSEFDRIALELGQLDDFEDWRYDEESDSSLYDVKRLKERLGVLDKALSANDAPELVQYMRTQLTRYLGDIDNAGLFFSNRVGTKYLVEEYAALVCTVLEEIAKSSARDDKKLDKAFIVEQLKLTRQAFGRTALLLSGGGTLVRIILNITTTLVHSLMVFKTFRG